MSNNNSSAFAKTDYQQLISQLRSELGAVLKQPNSANKKLSDSRLKLAAIAALPTSIETELTLKESCNGTTRSFVIKDQTTCTTCANTKPINRLHCAECKGLGHTLNERQVELSLDAGLITGQEVRYPGLGANDIRSGKNGDLLVKIKVNEHPDFRIDGKNITSTVTVSLYEATLGSEIAVPTANGKMIMTLRPLTQPGSVYRLKGLGVGGGDQLVTIEISMPQMLTQEQIELFRKIKEIGDLSNSQEEPSLRKPVVSSYSITRTNLLSQSAKEASRLRSSAF